MKNWKKDIFNNFIKLNRGFDLPEKDIVDGIYPVVASTSIKAYHNKYKVNPPVVVTGRSGSLGTVQYINEKCWPLNTSLYVKDYKGNLPKYVFYFLKTLKLENFNAGAGVPSLNQNHLHKVPINIPKIEIQKKIASILSAYDDLIEKNNKRIAILEKMAEELYREWFVRLRFPEYEKTKIVKGIPEGWEVKYFQEELNFNTGKLNSNASIEDGEYPFFTCSNEIFRTNSYSFDTEAVLLAGNNANGVFPLKYFKGKFDAYQRTYIIKPLVEDKLSHKYIFFMFKSRLDFFKTISTGAATQFLTLKMLNKVKFVVPNKLTNDLFEKKISPMFEKIEILKNKNTLLKTSRDKLLSRLMSGKIDVENLDIHFPPSMKEG